MRALSSLSALLLYSVVFAQIPGFVPQNGLTGYWGFNGDADDHSGQAAHGVVNGATPAPDRFGEPDAAYHFNGASDHITLPANAGGIAGAPFFSMNYWMRTANDSTAQAAFALWHAEPAVPQGSPVGFITGYQGNNASVFHSYAHGFAVGTGAAPDLDEWNMVTIIYDGTISNEADRAIVYLNGIAQENNFECASCALIIPGTIGTLNDHTMFGARYQGSEVIDGFDGFLDDFAFWDRKLEYCEIYALFHAGISPVAGSIPHLQDPYDIIDGPVELSGLPEGGVFSGNGVSGNVFNPEDAGVGVHTITYDFTDDCGLPGTTSAEVTVITTASIAEGPVDPNARIFPNPGNGIFTLDMPLARDPFVQVFDPQGRLAFATRLNGINATMDLGHLTKGAYVILVQDTEVTATFKVVIE
jgi:hypothetical protein